MVILGSGGGRQDKRDQVLRAEGILALLKRSLEMLKDVVRCRGAKCLIVIARE